MPGTNATEAAADKLVLWPVHALGVQQAVMLPCVKIPDLATLDWPAARLAVELLMWSERDFATTALRWSQHLTGMAARRRDQRLRRVRSGQACRFDRPSGGTGEFLGRGFAAASSAPAQSGQRCAFPGLPRGEGAAADAPRQKARWPSLSMCLVPLFAQRQPQQVNLAVQSKQRRFATRQTFALTPPEKFKKKGNDQRARS
jgi:hypothetical protein